jgi:hypothetical protein
MLPKLKFNLKGYAGATAQVGEKQEENGLTGGTAFQDDGFTNNRALLMFAGQWLHRQGRMKLASA